jgi:hypothetical protein
MCGNSRHRQFWHAHPFRFVLLPRGQRLVVVTIEPDRHLEGMGLWKGVPGVTPY